MLRVFSCATAVILSASALAVCQQPRQPPQAAALVQRFQAAIADAKTSEERNTAARAYAKTLADEEQIALGRALVASSVPDQQVFGGALLVERGRERDGAPALASFVTRGGDLTPYFWSWLHGDDPKIAARAYIAIARALLADIDKLTGDPRRRAEQFVIDGGAGRPLLTYSRAAAEERLTALERDIR